MSGGNAEWNLKVGDDRCMVTQRGTLSVLNPQTAATLGKFRRCEEPIQLTSAICTQVMTGRCSARTVLELGRPLGRCLDQVSQS